MDDNELAQVIRRVAKYRSLNLYVLPAVSILTYISSGSTFIRWWYGWSLEEAGFWLNLTFWGGSIIICLLGPLVIRGWYRDRRFIRDAQKLEEHHKTSQDAPSWSKT